MASFIPGLGTGVGLSPGGGGGGGGGGAAGVMGMIGGLGSATPWGAAGKLAADLIGGHKKRKAEKKKLEYARGISDENYEAQQAYSDQINAAFGEGGQYAGAIGADRTSSGTSESSTSGRESTEQRVVANAEDTPMTAMLRQQLEGGLIGPTGTEALPGQYARERGRQKTELGAALENRVAGLGRTNVDIDKIAAGRGIEADYLDRTANLPLLNESIRAGRRGESANFLRARLGSKSKRRYSSRTSGSTTGRQSGDTVGDALRVYGAGRPPERQIVI